MMMMFQSLDFFLLSCFFLRVGCQTDKFLPPRNVSILWTSDFHVKLSWAKAENCTYQIKTDRGDFDLETSPWVSRKSIIMNGGCLPLSISAVCNGKEAEELSLDKCQELLVKDVQCYIHTSKQTFCSWLPVSNARDLHVFYRLIDESGKTSVDNTSQPPLQKCSSYNLTNDGGVSCKLQAKLYDDILFLFNATLNNKSVRNTFKIELKNTARPPALNWTATKTGDKLHISWTPPDILPVVEWTYEINYTQCDKSNVRKQQGGTSYELEKSPNCRSCVQIKASRKNTGESPWSDEKCFGKESPIALVSATIIIPLVLGGLVVIAIACCRKNKESIFPKVPVPLDLLSDISDNNNKSTVGKLYNPTEEEDNCKITLVMEPQNDKLNL